MGRLHDLLTHDHGRLDVLLADAGNPESYAGFRAGLLRHIGIEERLLFPLLRRTGSELQLVERLHRDHAALSALLMPPPTEKEIAAIRAILDEHNPLEENAGGLYDAVERAAGENLDKLLGEVAAFPAARVAPHADSEILRRTIDQLLRDRQR